MPQITREDKQRIARYVSHGCEGILKVEPRGHIGLHSAILETAVSTALTMWEREYESKHRPHLINTIAKPGQFPLPTPKIAKKRKKKNEDKAM